MSIFAVPARQSQYSRGLKRNTGALGREKPVWPLEVIEDVILECRREGAAISQGQLLMQTETGLAALPWQPGVDHESSFAMGDAESSYWRCARADGEGWAEYAERSTAYATQMAQSVAADARHTMPGELYVDLAWVTEDEPALFDLPGYERSEFEESIDSGASYSSRKGRSSRVQLAGAVPGSFHGVPSQDASSIPRDARFAWVRMRAKQLRCLTSLGQLEILRTDSPTAATEPVLGELGALRSVSIDTLRPNRWPPLHHLTHLRMLSVGVWRRPGDLDGFSSMTKLRVLQVGELGLPTLEPLSGLHDLRGLYIYVRRPVPTLAPLARLQELRRLRFWGGTEDGSLQPLASLHRLKKLELRTSSFALEQFAELAVALPDTEGAHHTPFREAWGWQTQLIACKRCGTPASHYTLGKPSLMMCSRCDGARIASHVANWEILISAARARQRDPGAS